MSKPSSNAPTSALNHAELQWRENGQPISTAFDDIYFSAASGIEETRHVFINANQLTERFQNLSVNEVFTIGETGFGTGLNFLCAWQHFERYAPESAQLHFVSTEKFPLSPEDLQRSLSMWPELADYTTVLTRHHFSACTGHQHIKLNHGRVRLTLLMGDVLEMLPELDGTVDAWFLDGFSPAKNPDMWQPALFQAMASKSHTDTTYATFTAARFVRDGLAEAGVTVEKAKGFGHKRDMIKGGVASRNLPSDSVNGNRQLWFQAAPSLPEEKKAIVVGGGLSGCSTARALADRGWQVTLIEQHKSLAQAASGNPQGILYSKLSANQTPLSRFIVQGYLYSLNLLNDFKDRADYLWNPSGVIQLAIDDKTQLRHKALGEHFPADILSFHTKENLSRRAGMPIHYDGLFFPAAGWVQPAELCKVLADHPNIDIYSCQHLQTLTKIENQWVLTTVHTEDHSEQTYKSPYVVIACATATRDIEQLRHLPLKSIRGQISTVAATGQSSQLSATVCGEGYAAPAFNGVHTVGATFDFTSTSADVLENDHRENLTMQEKCNPAFYGALGGKDVQILGGRASFRCTTPDYLPVVGKAVDATQFLADYGMLRKNVKHPFTQPPSYHEGLYINAGHGSRGLITCPLSGEILAAIMNGECSPLPSDLRDALNPTRFLVRALSKGQM